MVRCRTRPFLFILRLHSMIWHHDSKTGALMCLLPANPIQGPIIHHGPPSPAAQEPSHEDQTMATIFYNLMALHPCPHHSNGRAAWSTLGRISIRHYSTRHWMICNLIPKPSPRMIMTFIVLKFEVVFDGCAQHYICWCICIPQVRSLLAVSSCKIRHRE